MREDLKIFLYVIGGVSAPILVAWVWSLIKEKIQDYERKLSSNQSTTQSLRDQVNLISGSLTRTQQYVAREIVEIRNVVSLTETKDVNGVYLSQIDRVRENLHLIGVTLSKIQGRLSVLERRMDKGDSLTYTLYQIGVRFRRRLDLLQERVHLPQARPASLPPYPKVQNHASPSAQKPDAPSE